LALITIGSIFENYLTLTFLFEKPTLVGEIFLLKKFFDLSFWLEMKRNFDLLKLYLASSQIFTEFINFENSPI